MHTCQTICLACFQRKKYSLNVSIMFERMLFPNKKKKTKKERNQNCLLTIKQRHRDTFNYIASKGRQVSKIATYFRVKRICIISDILTYLLDLVCHLNFFFSFKLEYMSMFINIFIYRKDDVNQIQYLLSDIKKHI